MENTQAVSAAEGIAAALPGARVAETLYVKETGSRITLTQTMPDKSRLPYVTSAYTWLSTANGYEPIEITSGRASKDIHFKFEGLDKSIYIQTKPDGKRGRTDPNELMAAVISCMKSIKIPENIEELDKMIDDAKALVKSKVQDYSQKELDAFDSEYSNFCQAISAAKEIQSFIGGVATKAYITGRVWHKDVAKFKINAYGMKDYNSSDIIVKRGTKYYGISLKKKDRPTTADPTILNKSISNLLSNKTLANDYDNAVASFMKGVIEKAYAEGYITKVQYNRAKIGNGWKKIITTLPNDWMGKQLRGSGSIFSKIAEIFEKDAKTVASTVTQLIFKMDLQKLKEHDFDFALVTGVGDYGPKKGPVVSDGETLTIDTIAEKLHTLLESGEPHIRLDPTTVQPGTPGSTSAVLKMILSIGNMDLVDLAIRYKGSSSWSSQPSVTGTLTKKFKQFAKDI